MCIYQFFYIAISTFIYAGVSCFFSIVIRLLYTNIDLIALKPITAPTDTEEQSEPEGKPATEAVPEPTFEETHFVINSSQAENYSYNLNLSDYYRYSSEDNPGFDRNNWIIYKLIRITPSRIMKMQILCPPYKGDEDKDEKWYVQECLYRYCSFANDGHNPPRTYQKILQNQEKNAGLCSSLNTDSRFLTYNYDLTGQATCLF